MTVMTPPPTARPTASAPSLETIALLVEQSIREQRETRERLDARIDVTDLRLSGLESAIDGVRSNTTAQFLMITGQLSDTQKHVARIEEHVGLLTTKVTGHDKRFDSIDRRLDDHDKRFDSIDARLDDHDTRFDAIDRRLDDHDKRFDSIDARLDDHDKRFDSIDARLDTIDARLDDHDTRFDAIDTRLDTIDARLLTIVDGISELRQAVGCGATPSA